VFLPTRQTDLGDGKIRARSKKDGKTMLPSEDEVNDFGIRSVYNTFFPNPVRGARIVDVSNHAFPMESRIPKERL
jgi:hypothetical protein